MMGIDNKNKISLKFFQMLKNLAIDVC